MDISKIPIAIIGGGIGGLTIAKGLQNIGIKTIVFEKDACLDTRHKGYSLTIQDGLKALKNLGIENDEVFNKSPGFMIDYNTYDAKMQLLKADRHVSNFPIPRKVLRELIHDKLTLEIKWNHKLIDFIEESDGVTLTFEVINDSKSTIKIIKCEYVIACEGVHSKIRDKIIGDRLNYLGVIAVMGITDAINKGNNEFQIIDNMNRLFSKPYSNKQIMWQFTFNVSDLSFYTSKEQIMKKIMENISTWPDHIKKLIENTSIDTIRFGPIYDRDPLVNPLPLNSKITLIGDSAHPMSPFIGQGANQAMIDAYVLTEMIIKNKENIVKAFREYEKEMIVRTSPYILKSRANVFKIHKPINN
ncbi:MAG: monooxygenase, FAD-binding domain-containing protein [Edafosvirus sp.]|uniref:Monooxygenase, FAD-binding domain-containing protein n=1 Tax=Edafosvirus sp. TaxID=2487765 RepID=A0A3G4ZXX2_9VIRU|nr:MAG: monooxygenase, FAD-binding domain-containing protein [Edafosvirus sp.]